MNSWITTPARGRGPSGRGGAPQLRSHDRGRADRPLTAPIVHVLGARPNFVKAAPVIAALGERHQETGDSDQVVIHTGQHYDERMSEVFFTELGLPEPDVNLGVGSGTHAAQTAAVMSRRSELLRMVGAERHEERGFFTA